MRVLVVGDWPSGGGVITVMRDVARHLHPQVRFDVFFHNACAGVSPWSQFCKNVYYRRDQSLAEVLIAEKFDVVHFIDAACSPVYGSNCWLDRSRFRGGVICNFHVLDSAVPFEQRAHVLVAVSEAAKVAAEVQVDRSVRVLWNGVDRTRYYRTKNPTVSATGPVVAWVGRSSDPRKNFKSFLELVCIAPQSWKFWVASPGVKPADSSCDPAILSSITWFSDLTADDMPEFYRRIADSGGCVLSTSTPISESFQLSLLEGAACGCIPIAPRANWTSHLTNYETALLYDQSRGAMAICECLDLLYSNLIVDRIRLGVSRLIDESLNSETMAAGYLSAYTTSVEMARQTGASRFDSIARVAWWCALQVRRWKHRLPQIN